MAAGGDQSANSPKSSTSSLIWSLLEVSEKAARIARECRARKELFDLLVEEKIGKDKNPRMAQDFKTLTDVLVQETVKHNLCAKVLLRCTAYSCLFDDLYDDQCGPLCGI